MMAAVGITAVGLLLLGVPLWVVLFASSWVGLLISGLPMDVAARAISGSLDNYVLLAVPGFIFVGEVFGRTGMADRLVAWITSLTGWIPGSMPVSTVATSELFGAISGSSPATVAAIGRTLRPALQSRGYGDRFSLGLVTSSGAIAVIIPPSIAMILYAVSADTSIADLFLAGIVPGLLVGAALAGYGIWYSVRHARDSRIPFTWTAAARSMKRAAWTLGTPLIIFGGIYGGVLTPTEAAGASAVYVAAVAMFAHRALGLRGLFEVTRDSALLTSKIFLIVASAGLFSFVLTTSGIPADIAGLAGNQQLPAWASMLLIIAVLLIAGMFVEPTSAMLVFTPLLLPVALAHGVDPVHFGLVMTIGVAIGMFTPPFGLNLFISQSLFQVPAGMLARSVAPFIGLNVAVLFLVAYVPALSLWLPDRFG